MKLKILIKKNQLLWFIIKPFATLRARFIRIRKLKSQEAFVRSVVGGDVKLTLDNIPGTFTIQATSDIARRIIFENVYEPEVTRVLKNIIPPGGTIINIGANVGLIAAYFARIVRVNKVIAIEPNPEAFKLLLENINQNNLEDFIIPINACIGGENGVVKFTFITGKPEYSSVNGIVHPAVAKDDFQSTYIQQMPLDSVVSEATVTLVFVDVEGAEEFVFRGAENILKQHKPILFFECSDILLNKFGGSSRQLENYLQTLGYTLRNAFDATIDISHPFEGEVVARYNLMPKELLQPADKNNK